MQYPEVLLPRTHFKRIDVDLSQHHICRTTSTKDFLNTAGIIKDEELFHDEKEFLDYSTNHLGQFRLEFNFLTLCGDNKKYYRAYWTFTDDVTCPVFEQDFINDPTKGFFFFKIGDIHRKIQFPLDKNSKQKQDVFTAIVKHTPTNSNFWHFSILWVDSEDNEVSSNMSKWKNALVASIRARLINNCIFEVPDSVFIEESHYCKA